MLLEHRDRELEVVLGIARQLKHRHGLSVAVGSTLYDKITAPLRVVPTVVAFPTRTAMMSVFYATYGDDVVYVNMNWEQMLSEFNMRYRRPRGAFVTETVKHCAWGSAFRQFLVENGVAERNVFITGRPINTILKRAATRAGELRERLGRQFNMDTRRRWLFFPMTCLHAFFSDYHVRSFVGAEIAEEMAFGRRAYVLSTLEEIFRWIAALTEGSERIEVIMRPHPAVSARQHEDLFIATVGRVPRHVHVIKDHTALEWLVASDLCYTNYSSLALDAWVVGKPAFLLEPEPFPDYLRYEWFDAFRRLNTREAFLESVDTGSDSRVGHDSLIERQFDFSKDGIDETARVLADLAASRKAVRPRRSSIGFLKATLESPRHPLGSLGRLAAMRWGLSGLVRSGIRLDYVPDDEIERGLEA